MDGLTVILLSQSINKKRNSEAMIFSRSCASESPGSIKNNPSVQTVTYTNYIRMSKDWDPVITI